MGEGGAMVQIVVVINLLGRKSREEKSATGRSGAERRGEEVGNADV
jgi:hypothetical protein